MIAWSDRHLWVSTNQAIKFFVDNYFSLRTKYAHGEPFFDENAESVHSCRACDPSTPYWVLYFQVPLLKQTTNYDGEQNSFEGIRFYEWLAFFAHQYQLSPFDRVSLITHPGL